MKRMKYIHLLLLFSAVFFASCDKKLDAMDPIPVTYAQVYMVGNATAAGWNIAAAIPMEKISESESVFTWTGDLIAGEIKFPTAKNYNSDTFMSAELNQAVSNGEALLALNGSPDQKWRLTAADAGNYTIVLDMLKRTVIFEKNE